MPCRISQAPWRIPQHRQAPQRSCRGIPASFHHQERRTVRRKIHRKHAGRRHRDSCRLAARDRNGRSILRAGIDDRQKQPRSIRTDQRLLQPVMRQLRRSWRPAVPAWAAATCTRPLQGSRAPPRQSCQETCATTAAACLRSCNSTCTPTAHGPAAASSAKPRSDADWKPLLRILLEAALQYSLKSRRRIGRSCASGVGSSFRIALIASIDVAF